MSPTENQCINNLTQEPLHSLTDDQRKVLEPVDFEEQSLDQIVNRERKPARTIKTFLLSAILEI